MNLSFTSASRRCNNFFSLSSSQAHVILRVASAWTHVVGSAILRIWLPRRVVVHVARVVLRASAHGRLPFECKLLPYLQYLGDPGRIWTLPYVDQVVVRHLPEDEEYQKLYWIEKEGISRNGVWITGNDKKRTVVDFMRSLLTLKPNCTYDSESEKRFTEPSRPFSCTDSLFKSYRINSHVMS